MFLYACFALEARIPICMGLFEMDSLICFFIVLYHNQNAHSYLLIVYYGLCFLDAAVRQAKWGASKVRDKLCRDIDSHAFSVRSTKLLELTTNFEVIMMSLYNHHLQTKKNPPPKPFSTGWVNCINQTMP